jgi:predicted nucleotidyltransferase
MADSASTPNTSDVAALAQDFDLAAVYVFGSRAGEIVASASGTAPSGERSESDVDIGVQPERGSSLSARQRVQLALKMEEMFKVSRVDLVILPEANAFLAADIVRGELLYCCDSVQEAKLQLYYLRRAGDLAPFLRERWRELVGAEL